MDDPLIVASLAIAGGAILIVVLLIVLRPMLGGGRTGYIDPGGDPGGGSD